MFAMRLLGLVLSCCLGTARASASEAFAPEESASTSSGADNKPIAAETWNVHGQLTTVVQHHGDFSSPYMGANSLDARHSTKETTDLTLYLGVRPWAGAEVYLNPEIDEGFGLSNTLGMAGFPSAEAYKVGASKPYFRLPRVFLRQVIPFSGSAEAQESGPNQLAGPQPTDNLTVTLGKFSVTDVFDTNVYAHDPRADFLNWAIVDSGAFDYAADAWGYSSGAALEWKQSWWTLRSGLFSLSKEPNSKELDYGFKQFAAIEELEVRHSIAAHPGKVKLLAFLNRGRMGDYRQALALADANAANPDTSLVRRYAGSAGGALNIEQEIAADVGVFLRASLNEGSKEAFEFTEINRSTALGLSIKGARWQRPSDTFGLAVAVNGLSSAARSYFAAGGMGILIGDGRLPNYGTERIAESFYSLRCFAALTLSLDYQFVEHPAYNRDRGPVSIFGARIHAEF